MLGSDDPAALLRGVEEDLDECTGCMGSELHIRKPCAASTACRERMS